MKSEAIAKEIGCSSRTVRRELAKGKTELLNSDLSTRIEYSADIGQQKHDYAGTAKGPMLKIGTEPKTREEIIRKIKSKLQYCVVKELDKIERKLGSKKFREKFKTITCDNGCENLDYEGIERSILTKGSRTRAYYAHPYSAWERGSNENANKLIIRFIPKGADIAKFSHERIKATPHNLCAVLP